MGKNVQLPSRLALFRSLVDSGILFTVQWALGLPENDPDSKPMISAGGEVFSALLDHDLHGVRGHVVKQLNAFDKQRLAGKKDVDKAETLLLLLCRLMAQSKDLALQGQVGEALKTWMDVPQTDAEVSAVFYLWQLFC
jgi:protein phosphatase-4 regulatory subunit 3